MVFVPSMGTIPQKPDLPEDGSPSLGWC